jgi:polysaccharide chain length determinant protein (PEP-CTERM system associated)
MLKEPRVLRKTPRAGGEQAFPASFPQHPHEYAEILRFRWPWIVVSILLGAVLSQVAVRLVPKQYVSQTVVLVESDKIPKSFIPQLSTQETQDRLRTVHEEILARPRIERILDELDPYPEMIDVPRADIVDKIRNRATIGLRGKDAFVVAYTDTNPDRAQRMATRLASMFIEETSGDRARQVQGANEFIDSQLVESKSELEQVESSLRQIKQRYMGMLPNQLEANLATLQRMELERQSVAEQIRVARERRGVLERQLALQTQMDEPEAQLVPEISASDGTTGPTGASNLPSLKAYLASLQTRYTSEHPEVVATQKRIARLEAEMAAAAAAQASLAAMTPAGEGNGEDEEDSAPAIDFLVTDLTAQVGTVDRDIANLEAREEHLRRQIGVYQARVEKIPEVEQELQSLERDYELISRYYSELLSRKLEAETADAVEKKWQEEQFKILDPAQVPDNPVFPRPPVFLLLGTLIGLGVGAVLAFLFEIADPTVKNMRELESLLPYPVLLTLPRLKQPRKRFRRRGTSPIPPAPPVVGAGDDALEAAS